MHGFRILGVVHGAVHGAIIIGPASVIVGLISQSITAGITTFVIFEIVAAALGYLVVRAFED